MVMNMMKNMIMKMRMMNMGKRMVTARKPSTIIYSISKMPSAKRFMLLQREK